MSDEPVKKCPECGKAVRRLVSGGVGVIFKGSGFYVTDKDKSAKSACSKREVCPKGDSCPKADTTPKADAAPKTDGVAKGDSAPKTDGASKGDGAAKGAKGKAKPAA